MLALPPIIELNDGRCAASILLQGFTVPVVAAAAAAAAAAEKAAF